MKDKKELIRAIKFTLFSISAGLIQIVSFELLHALTELPYEVKHIIALILSVIWNFTLNRNYTFSKDNNITIAMLKVAAYYLVFTPTSAIFGKFLVNSCHINETIVELINMLLNFITEFLFQRYVVYGKSLQKENDK